MEVELARAKLDLMNLERQLMEAVQQKLQLSQQLEQWQVSRCRDNGCHDDCSLLSHVLYHCQFPCVFLGTVSLTFAIVSL